MGAALVGRLLQVGQAWTRAICNEDAFSYSRDLGIDILLSKCSVLRVDGFFFNSCDEGVDSASAAEQMQQSSQDLAW